jgi:CheY-like chemotaxis protein
MAQRPLRILLVDDRAAVVESAALLLTLFGHEVETAFGGREAIEAARLIKPDLIFLDIGLPDLDGWQVARQLRELHWDRPPLLIAVTAYDSEEAFRESQNAGFDHHVVKPANLTTLTDALANEWRDHQRHRPFALHHSPMPSTR